ncbi:hypothetical protein AB0D14_09045 [Streptomyces sp. NPDC048484]|uniref:PspA-associated protein PspAB n=1 Tax=Streptomyces sp. NPDC048484 TaxID=3155146 RepID=UPI003416D595
MGFLDVLLGRTKPVKQDLDQLFGLPSAAITLQAASGLTPTGAGSVCFAARPERSPDSEARGRDGPRASVSDVVLVPT